MVGFPIRPFGGRFLYSIKYIMLKSKFIEVSVSNSTDKWYRSKGYEIPSRRVQLYCNINGKRYKNGTKRRVKRGTTIRVNVKDLLPHSNKIIYFICDTCGGDFTTTWQAHRDKISNNCKSCQAKKGFKGGCQDYWVDTLIINNPNAKCDISREKDKRFLELHHLLCKKLGGKNEKKNYIVLSANYHRAFHKWCGGTNVVCTPKQYYEFRKKELARIRKIQLQ